MRSFTFKHRSVALVAAVLASACARGPDVTSELPLRRVVVYRNGVAYFERAGEVDADRVTFHMRGKMVGDFLATLAIVERGGGSVRSASFPIDVEEKQGDGEAEPPPPPECPRYPLMPPCQPPPPEKKKADPAALKDVVLSLDGERHDLSIGYVAETPVWRPSYRVVVQPGGKADLQTWGIVQNLSGEDWTDVELVLVAGAPIAFQSTLGKPVLPERPVVNDSGEVIAAVPTGETTLAQAPAAEPAPPPMPELMPPSASRAVSADMMAEEAAPAEEGAGFGSGAGRLGGAAMKAKRAYAQPMAPAPAPAISAPRRMSALAAVAVESGSTRYGLPERVTVPDESATMVLLLHESVPGGAVFLFAPDPGVPDSSSHPFRVVRFTNTSKGLLERGPIAVFEKGSFLGEGVLEPLPPKATATVPFALERGLALQSESRFEEEGGRLFKIEASQLWLERDQVQKTTYRVTNGAGEPAHVLVKHPRRPGARLHQPPPGTEDNVGTGTALVPIDVAPHANAELVVDERAPYQQPVDWMSDLAALAVKAYLTDAKSDPKVVQSLAQAWAVRDKLRGLYDDRSLVSTEQSDLQRNTTETRDSLKALEKNKNAADLVAKLTERLRRDTDRLDALTKRAIELDLATREQEVRFRDAIRDVHLVTPANKE